MRFIIHAVALVGLLLPPVLGAQTPGQAPACRGDLDGDRLLTTIEFPDGYVVQGPWQVQWDRPASLDDGSTGVAIGASLDRIIEVNPDNGERVVTPFPEPIETTFEGKNEEELVYQAAQVWCLTVLKAQEQTRQDAQPSARTRTASY